MEPASPARLYAAGGGAFLIVLGIIGFFYSASFGSPGEVEEALGVLRVNAWLNVIYIAAGSLGLLAAGTASRPFALLAGLFFTLLGVWGFALGGEETIVELIPVATGNDVLNLALGLFGLAAAAGTPRLSRSEARAQAVR